MTIEDAASIESTHSTLSRPERPGSCSWGFKGKPNRLIQAHLPSCRPSGGEPIIPYGFPRRRIVLLLRGEVVDVRDESGLFPDAIGRAPELRRSLRPLPADKARDGLQRSGDGPAVSEFLANGETFRVERPRRPGIALQARYQSQFVKRIRDFRPIPERAADSQALFAERLRRLAVTLHRDHQAEISQGRSDAPQVTQFSPGCQTLLVIRLRRRGIALPEGYKAQPSKRFGDAGPVADFTTRRQALFMEGSRCRVIALYPCEEPQAAEAVGGPARILYSLPDLEALLMQRSGRSIVTLLKSQVASAIQSLCPRRR